LSLRAGRIGKIQYIKIGSNEKMEEEEQKLVEKKLKIEGQFKGGANWFFWIAGLSLVNSIILFTGSEWGFIVGLGITRIIDVVGLVIAEEVGIVGKILALFFDVIAAGIFVLFGVFSRKGYKWAFVVGMILYAMDGLIFLLVKDFLSIGFHVFALFCIYGGFKASRKLNEMGRKAILNTRQAPASDPPLAST
jgi:hypothetical protein